MAEVLDRELDPETRQILISMVKSTTFTHVYQQSVKESLQAEMKILESADSIEEVYRAQGAIRAYRRVLGLPDLLTRVSPSRK